MKINKISIPTHADYLLICVIGTRKELCEFMLEKFNSVIPQKNTDGEFFRMYSEGAEMAKGIVWINSDISRKRRLRTLVHESLHSAQRILNLLNIKVKANNHESLAYLQDYIFDKIYRKNVKFFNVKEKE